MDQSAQNSETETQANLSRADFWSSFLWIGLGLAIAVMSWRMDRLEHLQASIYTAPGLVPAFLGLAIAFMGVILLLRALRQGALLPRTSRPLVLAEHWRLIFSLGWSLFYALVIVSRTLPFWLITACYVSVFVLVFQYAERRAAGQVKRGLVVAVVHGLIAGLLIQYVFEELFLVRLP
ncbi:tripartite tricarboxylate transporter TctB family protein [Ferrovibrio sp.]|uniref:tripartite tricarboxylate transporter TctB family protein n=1 Tax=Ferrovibrio sp. TaxID=1917215 RepID=UPI001B6A66F5|nr:tripartite tricarboxylate transporter TctB family protein [Ferrovibrio sp.]MBP7063379.1 tripartite tricarboxylate transporter TctB family protein [Ferrovibrio sp.]